MRALRSYSIAAFICCLPFLHLHAQQKHTAPVATPPATIKATVDRQRIVIGEPIRLLLEVTVPDNVPLAWPGLDSLPHFDWLDKGGIDTTVRPGERDYRQTITITSFDSGAWTIPKLAFLAGGKKAFSDSIRIAVGYTPLDPKKDFHDIKDIVDVPNPFARWIGWIVAAVTLLSLALVIWLVRKKKLLPQRMAIRQTPRLSPYEEAMQQLEELQRQPLPDAAAMKTHYSRLGEILRVYLLRRFAISSFAETSEELVRQLRHQRLPEPVFNGLAEALRMSDFVKFAKYQPGIADCAQHHQAVRAAIQALEQRQQEEETRKSGEAPVIQQTNSV